MKSNGNGKVFGRNAAPSGEIPSIILVNPRFSHNVGMVVRLASCYGFKQVWFTGERVRLDLEQKKRLPREERMKGYKDVEMIQFDHPFDQFPSDAVPVAVEVRPNSERLHEFEHPKNAVYVFGPEDGSIPQPILRNCHRFVIIPTRKRHCLNLATATATMMWDRAVKLKEVPNETDEEPVGHEDTDPKSMGLFDTRPGWP